MKTQNKLMTVLWVIALCLAPITMQAGNDKGNGGDGVVLSAGEVVLYDLWERGLSPESASFYDPSKIAPYFRSLPENLFFYDNAVRSEVAQRLMYISDSKAFVYAVMDELEQLQWVKAPVDLNPNPDTKPILPSKDIKHIGCAMHLHSQVLVSPSCYGKMMSVSQKAALVLHEGVYRVYKKKYPTIENSFDVRTIIASIYSHAVLEKSLKSSGLEEYFDESKAMKNYFGGTQMQQDWIVCKGDSESYFSSFSMTQSYENATFRGRLVVAALPDTSEKAQFFASQAIKLPKAAHEYVNWNAYLPRYNAKDKTISLRLDGGEEEEYVKVRLTFSYETLRLEGKAWRAETFESEEPEKISASCKLVTHPKLEHRNPETWPVAE